MLITNKFAEWSGWLLELERSNVLLLLLVEEVELGRGSLHHPIPVEVDEAALLDNLGLDAAGELRRVLLLVATHRRQVVHVDHDGPRGHHEHEILEHGVLTRVPEGVAEARVVLDRHRVDERVDLEAALLEHHHGGVVDAGALGKDENGRVGALPDVLVHATRHQSAVLRLRPIEPDVLGRAAEGALHHAREAAMLLADHRVAVVRGQDDDVDGRGVIGHADRARPRLELLVVECDYGGEDTREDAVQDERGVPVEPALESAVADQADQEGRDEGVEAGEQK